MSIVGDAILKITDAYKINYSILGNSADFLHAHIFPRYLSENKKRLKIPVWLYPSSNWSDEKYQYTESEHRQIKSRIKSWLDLNY